MDDGGLNWFADSLGDLIDDWFALNDSLDVAALNWDGVLDRDWVVNAVLLSHFSALGLDGGGDGGGHGVGGGSHERSSVVAEELSVGLWFSLTLGQEVSGMADLVHDVLADALVLNTLLPELLGVAHPVGSGGALGGLNLFVLDGAVGWKSRSGKSDCSEQLGIGFGSGQGHGDQARDGDKLEHDAKLDGIWNNTHFPR